MKKFVPFIAVFSTVVLLSMFAIFSPPATAADTVDVIRLAGGDWGYPSPYTHYMRGPGHYKMTLIFDGLLERGEKGDIPWLAVSYIVEENGRAYRFKLRENVKWHDGRPFTSDDVAFTFDYIQKHPPVNAYVEEGDIEKVEILGPHEIKITISDPSAPMLSYLGRVRILPRHIWENVERPNEFTGEKAVIGTGPYVLTGYSKEHGTYRFNAWEDFWGPRQKVKVIEFIPASDEILALQKREVDLAYITPDVLEGFRKQGWQVAESPAFWGYRFVMNMVENPFLADVRFRRALAHAVDLDELVKKIARGAARPGNPGVLSPDHLMYNPDVTTYRHDPAKADKLLTEAGYGNRNEKGLRLGPDGKALSIEILACDQSARLAELLRQQLSRVGLDVSVRVIDRKSRDSAVVKGKFQTAVIGHGGWGRDADYLRERFGDSSKGGLAFSASTAAGYENKQLVELLEKQRVEYDTEKRKAFIFEAQKILADDVPEIPIFYTIRYSCFDGKKYDGWMFMYDHHNMTHGKLSYLDR